MKKLLTYSLAITLAVCTAHTNFGSASENTLATLAYVAIIQWQNLTAEESTVAPQSDYARKSISNTPRSTQKTPFKGFMLTDGEITPSHSEITLHRCSHPNCKKVYTRRDILKRHEHSHTGVKPFACTAGCTKSFYRKDARDKHSRLPHKAQPLISAAKPAPTTSDCLQSLPCTFAGCTESFSRKNQLMSHLITAHGDKKPYKCPEPNCTTTYASPGDLTRHLDRHKGIKRFVCSFEGCTQLCNRRDERDKHLETHTPKPHVPYASERALAASCYLIGDLKNYIDARERDQS